jgi:hypothetical protein
MKTNSLEGAQPSLELELSQEKFLEPIRALHRGAGAVVGFTAKGENGWDNLFAATIEELETMFPFLAKWLVQDAYFTVNSMFAKAPYPSRKTGLPGVLRKEKHLRFLNACYVDLDIGRAHGSDAQRKSQNIAAAELLDLMEAGALPQCSLFARSGRGAYVFWLLRDDADPTSPPRYWPERLTLYKKVNKAICKRLEQLAADERAFDGARVLRVPGTAHGTTGAKAVYSVQYDGSGRLFTYTLSELARLFGVREMDVSLPERARLLASEELVEVDEAARSFGSLNEPETAPARSVPARRNGLRALHAKRAQDLVCLEQSRGGWKKGHRKVCLSFYGHFLRGVGLNPREVLDAVNSMARNCDPPYPSDTSDTPLAQICREVFSGPYKKHTTANLVKWLAIEGHEARALELHTLLPLDVANERRPPRGGQQAQQKAARLELIADYILRFGMPSIRTLKVALEARGVVVGRGTVSRDLEELGFKGHASRKSSGRPAKGAQLALPTDGGETAD